MQRQTAVTAHFSSEQLQLFVFAVQAVQRQTAVTALFSSEQLQLFAFALQQRVRKHVEPVKAKYRGIYVCVRTCSPHGLTTYEDSQ